MLVNVRYFAVLRERRGLEAERVNTSATTVADLYQELAERHPLNLAPQLVRFAMGEEFVPPATPLEEEAEVALIPPVAGG